MNGVRFNTVDRDKNKKTQSCGVMAQGGSNDESFDFFGTLKEIVQLDYPETKGQQFCSNVTGLSWMGRRLHSKMMVF
jgi:hypothetical protein